jgi:hypothetical protein
VLLDDDTIVAVGTHQWRTRKGWTNKLDQGQMIDRHQGIGITSLRDDEVTERRHGYQRILLPLSLWTRPKNRTTV